MLRLGIFVVAHPQVPSRLFQSEVDTIRTQSQFVARCRQRILHPFRILRLTRQQGVESRQEQQRLPPAATNHIFSFHDAKIVQIECNTKRITFFIIAEMPPIFLKVVQIDCFRCSLSCVKVMKNRFYFWLFGKRKLPLQHHNMVKNRKSGTLPCQCTCFAEVKSHLQDQSIGLV